MKSNINFNTVHNLVRGCPRILSFMLLAISSALAWAEAQKTFEYEDVPKYQSGEPEWQQEHRLYRAYLDECETRLADFYSGWADQSQPISKSDYQQLPAVFQHAYDIFEDFYQPKNLARIASPEWGTEQFSKVRYLVTQGKLDVFVSDEVLEDPYADIATLSTFSATVTNFKPRVKGDTPALFLNQRHASILRQFLGEEQAPPGYDGVMSTAKAVGESRKRQEFLNKHLKIYEGHWGGWRLVTDPTVMRINFNKDYSRAIVHFSLIYQGGEALFERKQGKWTLIKSELTWIT